MDAAWDEQAVFLQALELPPERRAEFLRQACPDDARRERVEDLIRHYEVGEQERFLEAGLPQLDDSATESGHGWTKSDDATQTSKEYAPIDQFQRIIWLGGGGWGDVYLAEDTELRRRVAIKVLKPELTGSADALERFRNEARAAAALKHPGIVPVFTFGKSTEGHYIVSEFVDGPTLAKFIQRQRDERDTGGQTLSSRDYCRFVAEVIAGVADALEAAHRAKIIHRDVKPANIILEGGECPRLTDFGIAKQLDDRGSAADTRPLATPEYMSPEQASHAMARAVVIDHRSDVFSLGVVMYEMLALERPFRGKGMDMVRDVLEVEPIRLRRRDSRVPKDLETICHKCLEKEPQRRYQSAAHVAADLRAFLRNDPILAQPPRLVRRMWRFIRQRRMAVSVAGILALVASMIVLSHQLQTARDERLSWISIQSSVPGLAATIQAVDPHTLELGSPKKIGRLPVERFLTPPGRYRITVASTDHAATQFVEVDVLTLEPGSKESKRVIVHGDQEHARFSRSDRDLHAFLRARDDPRNADMVRIEAGQYWIGLEPDGNLPLEKRRQVVLPAFLIDKRETSIQDYDQFLKATGYEPPDHWDRFISDPELLARPVCVSFMDAEAYCRWRGVRLVSALEWQAGACGSEGQLYPWGDDYAQRPALLVIPEAEDLWRTRGFEEEFGRYSRNTVAVSSRDSMVVPTGLTHVFGNVSEMTSSIDTARRQVYIMGRAWSDSMETITLPTGGTYLLDRYSLKVGFRCAISDAPTF
ncbi:MAG: protein kinase [Phycisphaerales bacterium]|nr:protein kinase [Phycisphaerales bacterium]